MKTIKPREREAIVQSLRAGVVPRIGLAHIQVGRKDEVAAILSDLERIRNGSATIRFVIGRYGSGKSFFLNLARMVAVEKRFVVAQADITPDRRLHATSGQAAALFTELIRNLATRAKPEGGALESIVQKWVSDVDYEMRERGADDASITAEIGKRLRVLQEYVSGYDFATVIAKYYEGFQTDNDQLLNASLRWLRAEFTTKTEARQELGVRTIIGDADIYDYLKLLAAFVRLAGYAGLLVNLDEMGVLSHRLNNAQARNSNYEMILRILNDCMQGSVVGMGIMFGGTDAFLDDNRRGLASYEALRSRLAENAFARDGLRDLSGPVIRLVNLSPEDLYVLLHNIRGVYASWDPSKYLVPDEAIEAFLQHCSQTLGAQFFLTPRDSAKGFVQFLSLLEQNPNADWRALLSGVPLDHQSDPDDEPAEPTEAEAGEPAASSPDVRSADDELKTFRL